MNRSVSIAQIIAIVSATFDVPEHMITASIRVEAVVRARFAVMLLAREITGASLPLIGRAVGHRDHTAIGHGVARAAELAEVDPDYAARLAIARALVLRLADTGLMRLIASIDAVAIARAIAADPTRNAVAASTREVIAMAHWIVAMAGPDDPVLPDPLNLPLTHTETEHAA